MGETEELSATLRRNMQQIALSMWVCGFLCGVGFGIGCGILIMGAL